MKYTKTLNKPTKQQMADRCVPLEQKYEADGSWHDTPFYPDVNTLVRFMKKYNIPFSAKVVYGSCGSHTVELTW